MDPNNPYGSNYSDPFSGLQNDPNVAPGGPQFNWGNAMMGADIGAMGGSMFGNQAKQDTSGGGGPSASSMGSIFGSIGGPVFGALAGGLAGGFTNMGQQSQYGVTSRDLLGSPDVQGTMQGYRDQVGSLSQPYSPNTPWVKEALNAVQARTGAGQAPWATGGATQAMQGKAIAGAYSGMEAQRQAQLSQALQGAGGFAQMIQDRRDKIMRAIQLGDMAQAQALSRQVQDLTKQFQSYQMYGQRQQAMQSMYGQNNPYGQSGGFSSPQMMGPSTGDLTGGGGISSGSAAGSGMGVNPFGGMYGQSPVDMSGQFGTSQFDTSGMGQFGGFDMPNIPAGAA